jgi:hypothetical protein
VILQSLELELELELQRQPQRVALGKGAAHLFYVVSLGEQCLYLRIVAVTILELERQLRYG